MNWHYASLHVCLLVGTTAAFALPQLPKGMAPKDYYGGFYPTEEWVQSLRPVPRGQRQNPFQRIRIVETAPEGKDAWPSPLCLLTDEQLEGMKKDMRPYLSLQPKDLIGLVPRRNRISGNSRVMRATRMAPCPTGDAGSLVWTPDRPDELRCSKGHVVDPFRIYPPTGVFRIEGPRGEMQEYPYHDAPDGKRVYLNGEYMDSQRVRHLAQAARTLGRLYSATGDVEYARRAAAVLYDFARAVPHWPKIHRGRPGVVGPKRFRTVTEYTVYASIWYDKYHTGLVAGPDALALAYDFVINAPVWDDLDKLAPNGDARAAIEHDLFLYTVKDAIRYDIRYPKTSSALSNYIPYQIRGMICIGRAVGMPELVHYAYWKLRQLVQKTLMADGVFPESPSYARQHVYGMARACPLANGHTDPPDFVSTVDGERFEKLDMTRDLPELRRALEALETMVYPDDSYIMVHDTWSKLVSKGHPAPEKTRPLIYPSFGHAALARGERKRANQIQAHLHYSGNWGHDHDDMLGFILWAYGEELISDIGYAHTYRHFSDRSSGHNLVVVDRSTQGRVTDHGRLLGWHPAEGDVQVVEASGPGVYPQCSVYRRALFLIPLGEMDNVIVDIFTVTGGATHEWMAQGSCMSRQSLEVSIPTEFFADSYSDDGKPFTPPAHNEYVKQRIRHGLHPHRLSEDEPDPWYGVFRDVHRGRIGGPFVATFASKDRSLPDVRLHILEPTDADVYTCTVPSLRRCWTQAARGEDHSLVEKFRMPKLVIRRDGQNLHGRFVVVWEPTRGTNVLTEVKLLSPGNPNFVALEIRARAGGSAATARVFYGADPSKRESVGGVEFQGRYAIVVTNARGRRASLYDCAYFRDGDLVVTTRRRPPLAVEGVSQLDEDEYVIRLRGTWDDVLQGKPVELGRPELAFLRIGDGQRVFPIRAVETKGRRTLLRCTRNPGFTYDSESGALKDTFSPFLTYRGEAEVTLPSRVWLRSSRQKPGVWQIRTTVPAVVGSQRVGRRDEWAAVAGD